MNGLPETSGNLVEQSQSLFRLLDVKTRDGKACMDNDVVPRGDTVDHGDRYTAAYATNLDLRPLITEQRHDSHWNSQAHRSDRDRCDAFLAWRLRRDAAL